MFDGSFDIWHWVIVLVIVIAIFGTKKLSGAGSDLGAAIRNFKKAVKEGKQEAEHMKADIAPDPAPAGTPKQEGLDAPTTGRAAPETTSADAAASHGRAH